MLVAVAVLAILLVALGQMFDAASGTIKSGSKHLDSDSQARMIFDRIAADFAGMPKRCDIDAQFVSQTGNDRCFFYSEAPSFLPANASSQLQNSVALIGYQINSGYQLERLGYGLNWDTPAGASPASLVHLTFPVATAFTPDPASTINDGGSGGWSTVISSDGNGTNYHVLGEMVFRIEFCFLLSDGTYSTMPVLSNPPGTWPTTPAFFSPQGAPPTPSNSAPKYAVGSRWWDASHNRGYICTNALAGAASWRPLGWDDTAGIVVALALLDDSSRLLISGSVSKLSNAVSQLRDVSAADLAASPPQLMATTWGNKVNSTSFAATAGLPSTVAAQIRIYQRCIFLNNQNSL